VPSSPPRAPDKSAPFDKAADERVRREAAECREAAERDESSPNPLDELDRSLRAEDEGPLPPEAREAILATASVWAEQVTGRDAHALKALAPLFALHALWGWRTNFGAPGGMQAYHLIQRICAFAEPRFLAKRARASKHKPAPYDPRVVSATELATHFGADGPVVHAVWPCVRFLMALRDLPPDANEFNVLFEVGYLFRLLASVNLPMRTRDQKAASRRSNEGPTPGDELRLALSTHKLKKMAASRIDTESIDDLLGLVSMMTKRIEKAYAPSGNPIDAREYITASVRHELLSQPIRIRAGKVVSRLQLSIDRKSELIGNF
jgi:hypothetical protein